MAEDLGSWTWEELTEAAQEGLRGMGLLVEANRCLTLAVHRLEDSTTAQQKTTNNLTKWIVGLTVAIAILTATQVALIVIQFVG
jgi:hypothetical protein